ncbi:MAG: hypothetical protein RBT20_01825 [Syntrophales bacterium]|jgi:hypothetical protein|nr:hypothetical protein [Syntrophales bacterium]
MTKRKQIIDTSQSSLFDLIQEQNSAPSPHPGSMDIDKAFREGISAALKACPLSRYQVAARMSELVGQDVTKTMIDSWTAESKEQHRFPAVFLPAFCEVVGCSEPLKMLGRLVGVFVLPGPEVLRAEIRRIEEEILRKQGEKKKRLMFLKEMERSPS